MRLLLAGDVMLGRQLNEAHVDWQAAAPRRDTLSLFAGKGPSRKQDQRRDPGLAPLGQELGRWPKPGHRQLAGTLAEAGADVVFRRTCHLFRGAQS